MVASLYNLGMMHERLKDSIHAQDYYKRALQVAARIGFREGRTMAGQAMNRVKQ
jgi:hypothetical protein